MLELAEFKDYLSYIREARLRQDKFNEVLDELSPGYVNHCFMYDEYEMRVVTLLAKTFNDKKETLDALLNFVYDLNGLENRSLVIEDTSKCPYEEDEYGCEHLLYFSADTLYEYITRYLV